MNPQEMTMKTRTKTKTFTLAAIVAAGMGLAPAARAADKGCSAVTLLGTFSRHDTGTVLASPGGTGPVAFVGTFNFDGYGNVTGATTGSSFGNIGKGTQTGTYTVNSDCTGTITVKGVNSGNASHYSFVIDDNGDGFEYICTDTNPPTFLIVYSGVAKRQFPVGDWRNVTWPQ